MKTLLLTAILCSFSAIAAFAQTAPATTQVTPTSTAPATSPAKIGPPPANSQQAQILHSALSPETRSTLQDAMNSAPAPAPAKPASK
jgi:hypothetical protein